MRRIIATAAIAIALAGSYFAGAATQGDIMPAKAVGTSVSATLQTYTQTPEGKIYVSYADGSGWEFNSLQEAVEFCSQLETPDTAQRLLLAWGLARHADGNLRSVIGKTLVFDTSAAASIKVQ